VDPFTPRLPEPTVCVHSLAKHENCSVPSYHTCAQISPSPLARPAELRIDTPPGERDAFRERVMVRVVERGKSAWRVGCMTEHESWEVE